MEGVCRVDAVEHSRRRTLSHSRARCGAVAGGGRGRVSAGRGEGTGAGDEQQGTSVRLGWSGRRGGL